MIQANASPDPTGLGRRRFYLGLQAEKVPTASEKLAFYTKTGEKKRRNCQLKLAY